MYPHDDESVLSGIYTESGDASVANNTAVQAEQGRVMREFGVSPPINNYYMRSDAASVAEESASDSSELRGKTTSTPETYDEAYGVDDEESDSNDDGSTFHPNTLFPASDNPDMKQPDPMLTPRRLKIIMVVLCVIFVASIAVAMGSFFAQKQVDTPTQAQLDKDAADTDTDTDGQVPDMGQPTTTVPVSFPSASPTGPFDWNDGDCVDHPTKKFFINEQYEEQDCSFLRSNLDQRARLCLSEKEGYRWCPVTCGLCLKNIAPTISPTLTRTGTPSAAPVISTSSPTIAEKETEEDKNPPKKDPRNSDPPEALPTAEPTSKATVEPTPEPSAKPIEQDMPPTKAPTIASTSAPSTDSSSSFFCRSCPFYDL